MKENKDRKTHNITITFKDSAEMVRVITKLNQIDMKQENAMSSSTSRATKKAILEYIKKWDK